ncbi:hypothetical protein [Streptomyces sp. NPDC017260]|uniref:hypothetical protein n=1 Tax=unclassified Streptomyces TaxID=2593676 RepID=UPI00378D771E
MARRLVTTHAVLCDWHAALEEPAEIVASTQRTVASGKNIDLCGFCALVWDFCGPRIDEIKEMIRPEVVEALLRSARTSKEEMEEPPEPLQLTMHEAPPEHREAPPLPKRKSPANKPGQWIPGVEQVICPLPHRAGSPSPYWVKVRNRGSHAKSSHHKLGPEVPYELPDAQNPDPVSLPVKCFKHTVCAEAGGYGFTDEAGLKLHITKASGWPKATDAAATKASEAATVP